MQLAIELPDEIGKELLQQSNINQLMLEAVKKILLEQKQLKQSLKLSVSVDKTNTPITNSLVGVLKGSGLDESDYKKYLEEKYL